MAETKEQNNQQQDAKVEQQAKAQAEEQQKQTDKEQTKKEDSSAEVEKLQAEIVALKDNNLRLLAEMQNIRRANEQALSRAHKFALEKFALSLLPVIDSFEMGIQAIDEKQKTDQQLMENELLKSLFEGTKLTQKMLMDVLEKNNITTINPKGQLFDPQLHEAMSMQEHDTVKDNHIVFVVQTGYTLNERLLRPARVIVAKNTQQKK